MIIPKSLSSNISDERERFFMPKAKMAHCKQILKTYWTLFGILLIGAFIGLYQLNTLPGEMWGDAIAHYYLAQQMQHGVFFYNYRYGGDGPIYTYLVVLVSWFLGLSFYTLKLTSVFVYLFFIIFLYLLAEELFKKQEIAVISGFLAAVSFWSITFARQPHARMLVPLFITITLLFAIKNKKIAAGVFLGLGMYAQASFWGMPLVFWRRYKILLLGLLITIPLLYSFATEKTGFFTNQSYFGEKLAISDNLPLSNIIHNLIHNISANFFSFFLRGDQGFRLNVPLSPHLDIISALFFFIGFFLLIRTSIKKKQMKYFEFIILPFILIQIPSLLDIHNPTAQPNIGRMIGVIPFVYLATGYGITQTWHFIFSQTIQNKKLQKIFYYLCITYLLLIITAANLYKYFVIYPYFLPDQNTPFAKIIAHTIDSYPPQTTFVVIGSGWSEWHQPEQQAIIDSMTKKHTVFFLQSPPTTTLLCDTVKTISHAVLITSPVDKQTLIGLAACDKQFNAYFLQKGSFTIARVLQIKQ